MTLKSTDLVNLLGLKELPEEGGYFLRTYQSQESITLERGVRAVGDAIYYLITQDQFSGLHKLKCDEMWHFYAGDPVEMIIYSEDRLEVVELGNSDFNSHRPQKLIKANHWQGAKLKSDGKWALLGTNAFPAYEQADFELGTLELFKHLPPSQFEAIKRYVKQ